METDMMQEEVVAVTEEAPDISQLCRVCANPNEYLIPIFHGEGLEHDLKSKVSQHLPIQIRESDSLPVQLCYQCASTLIAWSDLVEGCSEADEKLRSMLPEGVQCEVILDTRKDLPSTSGKQFHPQISSVTSGALFKNQEEIAASAEVVEEQEVTTMDQDAEAIEPAQQRFLDSFSVYMQTQVALKRLQWTLSGALYCLYCGQFKRNFPEFMEHLMILHKYHCDRCEARFTDEAQLASHAGVHLSELLSAAEVVTTEQVEEVESPKVTPVLRKSKRKISQPVHLRTVPKRLQIRSDRQKFKCDLCPLVYLRQCYLDQHRLQFHAKIKKAPLQTKITKEVKPDANKFKRKKLPSKDECEAVLFNVDVNYSDASDNDQEVAQNSDSSDDWGAKNVTRQNPERTFPCPVCKFVGNTHREMLSHKNKEHKDTKRATILARMEECKVYIDGVAHYQCSTCGKNFRYCYDCVRHQKTHTDELPFTCHLCGKSFRSNHSLNRHLNSVHEKIKRHECDICGWKFAERKACSDHRRLHTGEKPFICEVCGKAFATHTSIYCHRRIHTNYRPHKCPHCDRSFRTRQRLNDHVRIHTGARPYSCQLCFKTFRVRSEQQRHIQTHNTEKPYGCLECGARFALKRYLKQHMRKHPYATLNTIQHENTASQVEQATLYIL